MKPLVLISNDDGIGSANLHALADAIERAQFAEVLVVAPERERSAASHTITLHKPLRLHEQGKNRYSLSGTPVDCVYLGVIELAPRPVALVLSGINRGYNLGSDVFYSGTVAAAVEGGLRGIPGIAFSIDPARERDLDAALRFAVALIARVLDEGLPERTVLNVNLPGRTGATYAWTRLGNRVYQDDVTQRMDPRGRPYYWIGGGLAEMDHGPGTDCHAVAHGVVSITPLHLDLTSHEILAAKRVWHVDGYECIDPPGNLP
jgi:5'-nucleotidase